MIVCSFIVSVETSETCSSSNTLKVSRSQGIIASAVAKQSGCGTVNVPWVISLKEGQKVTVQFVDFLAHHSGESESDNGKCKPLGYVIKWSVNI